MDSLQSENTWEFIHIAKGRKPIKRNLVLETRRESLNNASKVQLTKDFCRNRG